jgi:excisionase family DNA binding protein
VSDKRAEQHGGDNLDPATEYGLRVLLKVEEAAARLQIGRTTMYQLVRRGEIESIPIGRLRRIPADCLDEYVARVRAQGRPGPNTAAWTGSPRAVLPAEC